MAKFCNNCGYKLDEGSVFCENCGTRIGDAPQPAPSAPPTPPAPPVPPAAPTPTPSPTPQPTPAPNPQPAPPSAPSPAPGPYASMPMSPPPPKKKKGALIAVIVSGIVLLLAAAAIVLFVYPGVLKEDDSAATETVTETVTETAEPSEEPTEKPTEEPTEKPTEMPTPEPSVSVDISNVGKPSGSDFGWLYTDLGLGAPQNAMILSSVYDIEGNWKMITDYFGGEVLETANLDISMNGSNIKAVYTPYQVNYGNGYEANNVPSLSLGGSFDMGGIYLTGNIGNVTINQFYELDGKQYGIGTLYNPSGETGVVGLVRP